MQPQLNREAIAQMAESVDALVSNTSGAIHPGSIPGLGTKSCKFSTCGSFFCFSTSYRLVYWHQRLLSLFSNEASILGFTLHLFARNPDKQREKRGEGQVPWVHLAFTPLHFIIYRWRISPYLQEENLLIYRGSNSSLLHDNLLSIHDVKSGRNWHCDILASLHIRLFHHLTTQTIDTHCLRLVGRNQDFSIATTH